MILAIRGDKGIHFINGPPEYNQFDGFAPDAAKNCKVSFSFIMFSISFEKYHFNEMQNSIIPITLKCLMSSTSIHLL
jgi:hypothetical protein